MIDYISYLLLENEDFKKYIYIYFVGRPTPYVILRFSLQHAELSQPMDKTEFSSTAKNRTNSVS